jgi:hypothetical protein
VRRRDAEVGADTVPLIRLNRSSVLVDRPAHDRDALADEDLGLVRLETLAERRRADDVREEDGDRTALVLEPTGSDRLGCLRRTRLRRDGDRRCQLDGWAERLVLAQDRLLELAQLSARLEPELLAQQPPVSPVGLERLRGAGRAVEGDHELGAQTLVVRMEADERLQLRHRLCLPAEGEHRLEALLEGLQAKRF